MNMHARVHARTYACAHMHTHRHHATPICPRKLENPCNTMGQFNMNKKITKISFLLELGNFNICNWIAKKNFFQILLKPLSTFFLT